MINVALFGFGRIGQMHAKNLTKIKEIKLLYVYEKINQLSYKAKKLYGCKIEKNYNKIFNDKNVDIIFISSPTNTHIKFIEEGIKHKKTIFCEKPLDLNIGKIIKTFKKVKKNHGSRLISFLPELSSLVILILQIVLNLTIISLSTKVITLIKIINQKNQKFERQKTF